MPSPDPVEGKEEDPHAGQDTSGQHQETSEGNAWETIFRLDNLLDATLLSGLIIGLSYLVGRSYFEAYLGALGIPTHEIIFSLPTYASAGFRKSLIILIPLAYFLFDVLNETEVDEVRKWLGKFSAIVLATIVFTQALILANLRRSSYHIPVADEPGLTVILYVSLGIILLSLVIKALNITGFLDLPAQFSHLKDPAGWAMLAIFVIGILSMNAMVLGIGAAERLKSGDSATAVQVTLTNGSLPEKNSSALYHVASHDSRFYLIEIWKQDGDWREVVHIVPDSSIRKLQLAGR